MEKRRLCLRALNAYMTKKTGYWCLLELIVRVVDWNLSRLLDARQILWGTWSCGIVYSATACEGCKSVHVYRPEFLQHIVFANTMKNRLAAGTQLEVLGWFSKPKSDG